MRRDALAPAGVTHALGRGRLDVDPIGRDTDVLREMAHHLFDMRPHARCLGDHGRVQVLDPPAAFGERIAHPAQQDAAVDIAVLRIAVRKMATDIAEAGRTEHGVTDRVDQHVTVRVRLEPTLVVDSDPANDDEPTVTKTVGIKTVTDTHQHRPVRLDNSRACYHPRHAKLGPMELFDSHCHIDVAEFDDDRQQVLAEARRGGVNGILVPGVQRATWPSLLTLCNSDPNLYPALGLHPVYLDAHRDEDLPALAEQIARTRPLAVGEIGLDWYLDGLDRQRQQHLLEAQLEIAEQTALPVVLHVRKAHDPMLNTLRRYRLHGGFCHAFNGSLQQAARYVELGFRLGFGGMLTYERSKHLRRLAGELALDALVLETDAPDMAVASHQYQRNSPAYLPEVLRVLASLRNEEAGEIATQTPANAREVLGL